MTGAASDQYLHFIDPLAVVYRTYDADDQLLYVGCTGNLRQRLASHRLTSEWWPLATRIEIEQELSRDLAQILERNQIVGRAPLFNRTANYKRGWDYARGGLTYFPERDEFCDQVAA